MTLLTPAALARALEVRDLTDPAEGPHAIQLLVDTAVDALHRRWGSAVRVHRGARVVTRADNYDRLRYPVDAVTRDARYTRTIDADHVLRSHTSALVPPALRELAAAPAAGDDLLIACPGVVYRRDQIDRLHTATPHQMDLWRVVRDRTLDGRDLEEMIAVLIDVLLPGRRWRTEARRHPYTLEGRQVDVRDGAEWVEVCECGLAHPEVLVGAGLRGWSGLALGVGLDRVLMLRKGIPDIRLLRSEDPRVSAQLRDLEPYRPVSSLPAVRRDLSVAVAADDDVETLGDRVREALGDEADTVESVVVLSETPYAELTPAAIERLGIGPDQKNVLVGCVLRPFGRTLTDADANRLRDRIYAALHQGRVAQWAAADQSRRQ